MRLFILGCNGMAGHMISIYMKEKGYDVVGFARSKSVFLDAVIGDVHDLELVRFTIQSGKFDAVINCIGLLNQFAEEKRADAVFLNSYIPHYLAEITSDNHTQIIHISTDCVFSGKRGGYTEFDERDGKKFYDRSKAMGELEDRKNLTLRQSIVGPDIKKNGIGLLNWFMQQNGEVRGYTKTLWTGQTTLQLAKTIEIAVHEGACGLINAVPDTSISKYELLKLFNHYFRDDKIVIQPYDNFVCDKTLIRKNFEFDFTIPDYEEMVAEMSLWVKKHKYLYPHYNL